MVIWIIGLSGAGKTTLGRALFARMKETNPSLVFLDGDHVREIMGSDLGHTVEDRNKNGWRICKLCKWLDEQNIDMICCVLSMFPEQRDWCRENLSSYFEVFVDASMESLHARDSKGLYRAAVAGEIKDVVGVDLPFPRPTKADLIIDNSEPAEIYDDKIEAILSALSKS